MYVRKITLLAIKPSIFSFVVSLFFSAGFIFALDWPFFSYSPAMFDTLFGNYGWVGIIENAVDYTKNLSAGLLTSGGRAYMIFVGLFALFAGLSAYILTYILRGMVGKVNGVWHLTQWRNTDNQRAYTHGVMISFAVRATVFIGWILYAWLFFSAILPTCLLLARIGANDILSVVGLLRFVAAIAGLVLALHLHVVFARFAMLRPRVFGAQDIIEATSDKRYDN